MLVFKSSFWGTGTNHTCFLCPASVSSALSTAFILQVHNTQWEISSTEINLRLLTKFKKKKRKKDSLADSPQYIHHFGCAILSAITLICKRNNSEMTCFPSTSSSHGQLPQWAPCSEPIWVLCQLSSMPQSLTKLFLNSTLRCISLSNSTRVHSQQHAWRTAGQLSSLLGQKYILTDCQHCTTNEPGTKKKGQQ